MGAAAAIASKIVWISILNLVLVAHPLGINPSNQSEDGNRICRVYLATNAVYGKLRFESDGTRLQTQTYADCKLACQLDSSCEVFVWHDDVPDIVGESWVHACVVLNRPDVIRLSIATNALWQQQDGVVSGRCIDIKSSAQDAVREQRTASAAFMKLRQGQFSTVFRRMASLPMHLVSEKSFGHSVTIDSVQVAVESDFVDVGKVLEFVFSTNSTKVASTWHDGIEVSVHGPDLHARSKPNKNLVGNPISLRAVGFEFVPWIEGTYTVSFNIPTVGTYAWFQKVGPVQTNATAPAELNRLNRSLYSRILQRVLDVQQPTIRCNSDDDRKYYFYALAGGMNYGLGSHIEYMVAAFGRALSLNRTFVIPAETAASLDSVYGSQSIQYYWAEHLCPEQSWGCYFFLPSLCFDTDLNFGQAERLRTLRNLTAENNDETPASASDEVDPLVYIVDDGSPEFEEAEKTAKVVVGDPCQRDVTKAAFRELAVEFGLLDDVDDVNSNDGASIFQVPTYRFFVLAALRSCFNASCVRL